MIHADFFQPGSAGKTTLALLFLRQDPCSKLRSITEHAATPSTLDVFRVRWSIKQKDLCFIFTTGYEKVECVSFQIQFNVL
jgi:hypothetical protein